MLLNIIEQGSGDGVVVLLHGMMGSAESWRRVSRRLASRGRRVIALDLPGHGLSFRDPQATVGSAAEAVIETVRAVLPNAPVAWVGHSYGGTVLAEVAARIHVERAVYVDTTCAFTGGADAEALASRYERDRQRRMDPVWLRESRPYYSEGDAAVEARAAARFDPRTAAAISSGGGRSGRLEPGSILLRSDPSAFVTDGEAMRLSADGVDVRSIPGAAHTVWYSHFDEFCDALPEVFGRDVLTADT